MIGDTEVPTVSASRRRCSTNDIEMLLVNSAPNVLNTHTYGMPLVLLIRRNIFIHQRDLCELLSKVLLRVNAVLRFIPF